MECLDPENKNGEEKHLNSVEVTNTKEEDDRLTEPSESKIPKTDVKENTVANPVEAVESKENDLVEKSDPVEIKVIYNKKKYDITTTSNTTILELKKHLQDLLGVPDAMQKLMYKGLLQDTQTISNSGITKGSKIMLVGSTLNDVLAVSSVTKQDVVELEKATTSKEPLSKQKIHRKVLDKGLPEDVMPGLKNIKEGLPPVPLSGMLNKHGGKVRLTFKLESDQLWLSTKERTEKLPMGSIKSVISEPIEEHDEYHILGLQLGPTEASRYWIYWVPAQYIDAIKDAVLGKWQYF
ncbi:ubiquitin domain-containing protein UBFD1 [Diabrotica virgifera virgifera]|uniref:Ubiquitin domain-containing protein UBFD1-like n=1 Tax=Diabrotica virgifera virgifera TaxID=50390 RepID=A0A6P7FGB5_DIAVI|nr:ubiquitin domain-containing protein UBFD1 [Diabrotica virgifera virgifera]